MGNFKEVTKEELVAFIEAYPALKLQSDVYMVCEPPLQNFNDFSGGKVWPESMVATISLDDNEDERTYRILAP